MHRTLGQRLAVVSVFFFLVTTPAACAQTGQPSGNSAGAATWATIVVALIAAVGAFGGVLYTQRTTAKQKRNDDRNTLNQRLSTLRASLRAELTQLIEVTDDEIEFSKKAQFTWIPVRDYFETYRQNKDLNGMLNEREVELLTATMRILEERMGYIVRKSAMRNKNGPSASSQPDILPNLGPPIGQNIRIDYENDAEREDLRSDLEPISQAAREALGAIAANLPDMPPMLTRPSKRQLATT